MAALGDIQMSRLKRGIQKSRELLRPFIQQRTQIYSLIGGSRWGTGLRASMPIPYLKMVYGVFTRSLVSSNPRCMITTKVDELRPVSTAMQIAINNRIKQSRLVDAIRWAVSDALVGMGIIKVGVCQSPIEGTDGLVHDYNEIYCDSISLDDWVHDFGAKRFDQVGYCGHRVRRPRRALEQDPRYDQGVVKSLARLDRSMHDEMGNVKAESLSRSFDPAVDIDHEDMVELWEIWLPRENLVLLLPAVFGDVVTGQVLASWEYQGPELGPYHLLRYGEIPDNIMPSPPCLDLADLHLALNGLYRKVLKQGLNQKNHLLFTAGSEKDADRIKRAPDMEAVRVDDPQSVREAAWGNFSPNNLALFNDAKGAANYYAGNLESLAGLGPQSDTAAQDKMLLQSASAQIQGMQDITTQFTKGVLECMAWYWWMAPVTYQADVPIPGVAGATLPVTIEPQDREGHWLNLNFEIEPYSLQSQSPSSKLSNVNSLMQMLASWLPVMQQQNMAPDIEGWLRLVEAYGNMPEVSQLVRFANPPPVEEMSEPPRSPKPATRTYERVSRSAPTESSKGNAEIMALLGAATPQQEAMTK